VCQENTDITLTLCWVIVHEIALIFPHSFRAVLFDTFRGMSRMRASSITCNWRDYGAIMSTINNILSFKSFLQDFCVFYFPMHAFIMSIVEVFVSPMHEYYAQASHNVSSRLMTHPLLTTFIAKTVPQISDSWWFVGDKSCSVVS
jgi:hypothetical protein